MSDPEFDRIASLMPDCCICQIQVVNLEQDFEKRTDNPKTREMFHGTKARYVNNILNEGLRGSYNVTSAYGKGTYFSPDVKMSLFNYADRSRTDQISYVFLCDVVENEANGNKTNIFVCPRDDSFRIKYLINFYKG